MEEIIVETQYGRVRGAGLGPVLVWRGLPYARPPVGALRFRPPQPPEPWSGVRDATIAGPIAPQPPFLVANGSLEVEMPEPQNEDCLYLNIWAPRPDARKRPVMVWLHGGAFINGSGSQSDYDGASFAEQGDLILVTLNYRLGVLGFLYLEELLGEASDSSGNYGLLDQIAALRWIRENIAAFGGDPANITLFGESAGAISIALLLAMPAARGLFQRAILESGPVGSVQEKKSATDRSEQFLETLGLETHELAKLQALPWKEVLAAQSQWLRRNRLDGAQPVLDGKNLPETPLQAIARGTAQEVAILIGTNRDEVRLFTDTITGEKGEASLPVTAISTEFRKNVLKILRVYSKSKLFFWRTLVRSTLKIPDKGLHALQLEVITDYAARIPSIRLAEQQVRQGGPVWMYRFDWPSPHLQFGACHGLELPFVWNKLASASLGPLLGENPPSNLARQMHASWIAFARTGHPNIPDLPSWPAYDLEQRATMIFHNTCQVIDDPQAAERQIWDGLI
ncbi:MAG TPA: carboxylesterase/lipase family protein [Ktedonobacteraceae bacterium]|nr:carboxylesterase/lipase family protein [Ktedonobacteraceae bacterium]